MLLRSLFWGSEPFCNFRLRSPNSFPSTLPLHLYFHHSCLLYSPALLLLWSSQTSPVTVLVAPRRVMMMMMMSPFCLSLVLIVFLNFVCCPSWLAVLLCEVLALLKKHVTNGLRPRDWTKTIKKALWEEGYASLRAVGTSLMAINGFRPFCHSFCCKCRSC